MVSCGTQPIEGPEHGVARRLRLSGEHMSLSRD